MPITLEEMSIQLERRQAELPGVQKCACCGIPLQETITGKRPVDDGDYCSDCYFDMMSEEIDQHPILMPRPPLGI